MRLVATGQALIEAPVPADPAIAAFCADADLALANFEVPIATQDGHATKTGTSHAAPAEVMNALRAMGINALAHANNHAFDLGPPGIEATHRAAMAAGLAIAGSGRDLGTAGASATRNGVGMIAADLGPQADIVYAAADRAGVNALRVRRALALPSAEMDRARAWLEATGENAKRAMRVRAGMSKALAPGTLDLFGTTIEPGESIAWRWRADDDDLARLKSAIGGEGRVVVALHNHHWDADWSTPLAWYADLCRSLIDSGACAVVGTGVPVLQPIIFHRGKPIFTSLGNFIFHTHRPRTYDGSGIDVWSGAMCRWRDGDSIIEVLPITAGRLDGDMAPRPLAGDAAARVMSQLTRGLSPDERARVVRA